MQTSIMLDNLRTYSVWQGHNKCCILNNLVQSVIDGDGNLYIHLLLHVALDNAIEQTF